MPCVTKLLKLTNARRKNLYKTQTHVNCMKDLIEFDDDRRVIRWPLPAARLFIDPRTRATLRERG